MASDRVVIEPFKYVRVSDGDRVRVRRCAVVGAGANLSATDSVLRVDNSIIAATNCVIVGSGNLVKGMHNYLVGERNVTDDTRSTIDTVFAHPCRNVVCIGWDDESLASGAWRDVTEFPIDGVVPVKQLTRRFIFYDTAIPLTMDQGLFSRPEYRTTPPVPHLVPQPAPPPPSRVPAAPVEAPQTE